MRAIWKGTIGFGLVNIPVKLYSAVQASELDLDMLDSKDQSRVKFKRVNEKTGKEVSWGNIVKGYKYQDHYILLEDEDFEKASPEQTRTITIREFVDLDDIDPIYYETSYFLEPEKAGVRAYALLVKALAKTGKAGVSSFVLRQKESLATLREYEGALLLTKMRFEEELRPVSELVLPDQKSVKPSELKMALSLIQQFSSPFDISEYKDTYTEKLMKLIRLKARGKAPKAAKPKEAVAHSRTDELMSQLKASLSGKSKAK